MPRLGLRAGVVAILMIGVLATSSTAAIAAPQRLQVPGSALLGFSASVSADGRLALVGAPNTDGPLGAAYVFARSGGTWILRQKLQVTVPVAAGVQKFGTSVSLSADGRTALIGAQGTQPLITGQNRAYVFTSGLTGTFTLQQELTNPAGVSSGNQFGISVALSPDGWTAMVGAPTGTPTSGGAVYVYSRSVFGGWSVVQALGVGSTSPDGFGTSISTNGLAALIGAPTKNNNGAAYLFNRNLLGNFVNTQTLLASNGASGDAFGQSVALSGDGLRALVGAPQTDAGVVLGAGSAYVFGRVLLGPFLQQQELQATTRVAADVFGSSVWLDYFGRDALVGAPGKDATRGTAYRFSRGLYGPFFQSETFEAPVRTIGDNFGWSVTDSVSLLPSNQAFIGAPEISVGTGSEYVFPG